MIRFDQQIQLAVALENRPGQIAKLCERLAASGHDILGVSVQSLGETSEARLLLDEPEKALALLEAKGYPAQAERVLVLRLRDSRGKLAKLANTLAEAGVNVDYVYATVDEKGGGSRLVLKVSNIPLAAEILERLASEAA